MIFRASWTVTALPRRAGILHRVPLSDQAKQILLLARDLSGRSEGPIFPAQKGGKSGKFMCQANLGNVLKRLGIGMVPHGLRSTFTNWAAEQDDIKEAAAEMVLAHGPSEGVIKFYRTSDFFKKRQPIMRAWADYIAETMGPVVPTTPQVSKPQVSSENRGVQTSKAKPTPKAKPTGEAQHAPVPQEQITPDYSQDRNPVMQNWDRLLAESLVPVTPGVPA